ncbi:glycosyltransferase family 2 protein, partial [bacterium]
MTSGLSVCLIVRDEAERIRAALDSVRPIADEIIVVDTGSLDGTPGIAIALGARVESFPWRDDFAAARNFAFDLARGDWILSLDADQILENPEALPHPLTGEGYRLRIVDSGIESWRVGLFRAHARMIGKIHEYFDPPLRTIDCGIRLRHEGYSGGPNESKHRRNIPLLVSELAERPDRLDVRIELARTLNALGDDSALDDALAHIDPSSPPVAGYIAMLIETILMRPALKRPEWVSFYATRWFPTSPPIRWILARLAADAGDFELSRTHLQS